eukprot:COSAG01_NODE_12648_length_1704_cov_1.763863_2_plen_126_part_01
MRVWLRRQRVDNKRRTRASTQARSELENQAIRAGASDQTAINQQTYVHAGRQALVWCRDKTPRERRVEMSKWITGLTRQQLEHALRASDPSPAPATARVSNREYCEIRQHVCWPGIGEEIPEVKCG